MTRLPEVISTVKRRRAWSVEEKVAILDAAFSQGGSVAAAADRFGVARSLIYIWRQQVRDGQMPGVAMTAAGVSAFASVAITAETIKPDPVREPPALPAPADKPYRERRRGVAIEVRLVNGRSLKVDEGIAPDVLARLVAALDAGAA
jgi:transposase